ncbi:hypothetical protein DSO57_1020635 [Entomophthora muscae]|uniref:Uncharacterized protein n=1 Tax=Entomophthora muscae TaxID=34485 RepID=A0ACC2RUQ8_9FUNG|nr:hypothetical protein DSO57_1020635 [Entomophthora muscae]
MGRIIVTKSNAVHYFPRPNGPCAGKTIVTEADSTKELCRINTSTLTVNYTPDNSCNEKVFCCDTPPLTDRSSVDACKEKSKALVFRRVSVYGRSNISREENISRAWTKVDDIDLLYENDASKFYDGFEFEINYLDELLVRRLLEERRPDQKFSLIMNVFNWEDYEYDISKYASKVHQIVFFVQPGGEGLEDLEN